MMTTVTKTAGVLIGFPGAARRHALELFKGVLLLAALGVQVHPEFPAILLKAVHWRLTERQQTLYMGVLLG